MVKRFGKLREETAEIAEKMPYSPMRAFLHLAPSMKDGKRLRGKNREALEAWTAANAPDTDPDEVQTVSFSIMELANDLFGGTKGSAQHAIRGMCAFGLLTRIPNDACRGRSSLYAVSPLPSPHENHDGSGRDPPE